MTTGYGQRMKIGLYYYLYLSKMKGMVDNYDENKKYERN